jgi:hypothetical protein
LDDHFVKKSNINLTKEQLQSKLQTLKGKFTIFHSLVMNSGFGRDPDLKIPTAPDRTWKEYLDNCVRYTKMRDSAIFQNGDFNYKIAFFQNRTI